MFKRFFGFLKSKSFFKHLAIYVVSMLLLFWILLTLLKSSTNHGESIKVPDFTNVKLSELDKFSSDNSLRYLVIDSLYDPKAPTGTVIKQEPEPGAEVKENRIIFLYVTSIMPPMVQMPKLKDCSLRQASSMIITYGLKMDKPKYVPDQCANCVLDQQVKGKHIEPGEMIKKGTVIHLIVGKGLSDEEVGIPCLNGLTLKEAIDKLSDNALTIGAVNYETAKDSLSPASRIYRQIPSCGKDRTINMGATVDIFLTSDKSKISTQTDTTSTDDENPYDK